MNWKAVVGVSMLCITVMTGCTEKKMQSSKSNETVKKKVEVSKKDKEKEETVTEQGTLEDSSEEDTEEQKYKLQKIDISAKEQRRIEKRLTDVIEKCRGIYHGQTESVDTEQDGAENLASTELSEEIVHQLVDTVAEDGSWTLTVDAVFKEAGKDCLFRHEVKMKQKPDDGWIYCGNEINRDGTYRVPQYRARREYK